MENEKEQKLQIKHSQEERERILNTPFKELGLSTRALPGFKWTGVSNIRELEEFCSVRAKMREEGGFLCNGKYLTKGSVDELMRWVKENEMEWIFDEIS